MSLHPRAPKRHRPSGPSSSSDATPEETRARPRVGMVRIVCADDGTTVYLAADEAENTYLAPLAWSAEGGTVSANIPSSAVMCAVLFIRHGITPKPSDFASALGIVDAAFYLGVEGLVECTLRWIAKRLADPHCAASIPTLLHVIFTATQHGALPGADGATCMAARTLGRRLDTMTSTDLAALYALPPSDITVLFEHVCFCPASPAIALAALLAWHASPPEPGSTAGLHTSGLPPARWALEAQEAQEAQERDGHLTTLAEPWIERAKAVPSVLAALLLHPDVARNRRLVRCIGTALVGPLGPHGPLGPLGSYVHHGPLAARAARPGYAYLTHGTWAVAFAPDGSVSATRMPRGEGADLRYLDADLDADLEPDFATAAISLPRGINWTQHATVAETRLIAVASGRRVVVADLANPTPIMVYCISSGAYTTCPPLPRHTTDYAMSVCRDGIYVIGGIDPHSPTDDIWRIRTPDASGPRESWANVGNLDASRSGASATLIYPNGRPTIAVFGGAVRPGNALELIVPAPFFPGGAVSHAQTLSVPTSPDIDRKLHSAAVVSGPDGEYAIIIVGGRSWHADAPRAEVPHSISLSPASGRYTNEPLIAYAGPRSVVVTTGAHTVHVMGAPLPPRAPTGEPTVSVSAEASTPTAMYNACGYNVHTGLSKRGSCPAFTNGSAAICFDATNSGAMYT